MDSAEFIPWGRVAYEAYVRHCDGISLRGEVLPAWDGQAPEICAHWQAAALAVAEVLRPAIQAGSVVVRDQHGRPHQFTADDWTVHGDFRLDVTRDGKRVASFPPGMWSGVCHGTALAG